MRLGLFFISFAFISVCTLSSCSVLNIKNIRNPIDLHSDFVPPDEEVVFEFPDTLIFPLLKQPKKISPDFKAFLELDLSENNDSLSLVSFADSLSLRPDSVLLTGLGKSVERIGDWYEVKYDKRIHYDFNDSVIKPEYFPMLDSLADLIMKNNFNILVFGYSDSICGDSLNNIVAGRRAGIVKHYFADKGVDSSLVSAISGIFTEPRYLSDNSTYENRELNRRVEFWLRKKWEEIILPPITETTVKDSLKQMLILGISSYNADDFVEAAAYFNKAIKYSINRQGFLPVALNNFYFAKIAEDKGRSVIINSEHFKLIANFLTEETEALLPDSVNLLPELGFLRLQDTLYAIKDLYSIDEKKAYYLATLCSDLSEVCSKSGCYENALLFASRAIEQFEKIANSKSAINLICLYNKVTELFPKANQPINWGDTMCVYYNNKALAYNSGIEAELADLTNFNFMPTLRGTNILSKDLLIESLVLKTRILYKHLHGYVTEDTQLNYLTDAENITALYDKILYFLDERRLETKDEAGKLALGQIYSDLIEEAFRNTMWLYEIYEKRLSLENRESNLQEIKNKFFEYSERSKYPVLLNLLAEKQDKKPEMVSLKKIQLLLDDRTALIAYTAFDDKLVIHYVDNKIVRTEVLDYESELKQVLQHFSDADYINLKTCNKQGYYLYRKLLGKYIGDDIEKIVIIPCNDLQRLPFEALVSSRFNIRNPRYVIKDYEVVYNLSSSLYFTNAIGSNKKKSGSLLAVAPVSFSTEKNLPNSAILMDTLETGYVAIYNECKILEGDSASLSAFLKNAAQFDQLLISTHTRSGKSEYETSSLLFANDSVLSYSDICNSGGASKSLVVLSACKSGSGPYIAGEGVFSVGRAFLVNGTNNLVYSYLPVGDCFSRVFMTEFFLNISIYKDYSRAMQETKLTFIYADDQFVKKWTNTSGDKQTQISSNTIRDAWSHPTVWSRYFLVGE